MSTFTGEFDPVPLTANEHPWGTFPPKSWCIVQTVTVSNVDGRAVQSNQTVKTVLDSIDGEGITLQETETLELGGKKVEKKPQTIKYDFFRERIQENVQVQRGPPVKLMLNNKKVVPCEVRIYTQQTSSGHLTTTIWYSPFVYPFVLRVERIQRSSPSGDNSEGQIVRRSVTLVQETSALQKRRGSRRSRTYSQQTVEKTGNITKITDERCSWDVPGGLLESTTKELDVQNREIRRSVSRMTNYFSYSPVPVLMPYYPTVL
ncbi:MAG: hypothetical protein LBI05_05965 [Planctomycetaceae bacterium]|nr:hypothetical protein [Planctomycetaceae bacterium]